MVRVLDVDALEPNSPPNKSEILARTISTTTTGIAEVLGSNGCVGAASQKLRNRGHAVTRRTKLRCSPKRGYRLNIMEAFAHQQSGQPRVEIGARLWPVHISEVVLCKPSSPVGRRNRAVAGAVPAELVVCHWVSDESSAHRHGFWRPKKCPAIAEFQSLRVALSTVISDIHECRATARNTNRVVRLLKH